MRIASNASATYMRASGVARDRARRFRVNSETGELRESDHGQLVADWVELFAPVVFEPHKPTFWPPEGSLLLDHLPFRVRALDANGKRIPAGRVAFDVFCAVGYQAGKPKPWHAEAFIAEVERLSGREVLAFISNHHVGPDIEIELFVFRDGAGE